MKAIGNILRFAKWLKIFCFLGILHSKLAKRARMAPNLFFYKKLIWSSTEAEIYVDSKFF
jgi:hypothetical protein